MINTFIAVALSLFCIFSGIHLFTNGHPVWGVIIFLFGIPKIQFRHIDDGKNDIHITIKGVDNERTTND